MDDRTTLDAPLVGDFANYAPRPPTEVAIDRAVVRLGWADGTRGTFHPLFLAENGLPGAIDPLTRERLLDYSTLPHDLTVVEATVDAGGHLGVRFGELVEAARLHTGWLHAIASGDAGSSFAVPERVSWEVSGLVDLPTFHGPTVMHDDGALRDWLTAVVVHGVARLRDLPIEDRTVEQVALRIGVVRDTNFGRVFDVQSKPDADSTAYTAHPLLPHTDLPTRETPPGFQLLHCRANTSTGGSSVMVDGFAVAARVAALAPDAFANLTTTRWVHSNRSRHTDYRWSAPVIGVDHQGRVCEIRLLHVLRTVPDVPTDQIGAAYDALRLFTELTKGPGDIRSPFLPGDLVMFDNRRILHGREGFDPSTGVRHLQGCYVDSDDLYSRLRMLARP